MPFYRTNKWFYLLLITIGWILASLLVNPIGEFPINDDWAYARNVYHLAVEGVLKLSDWPAMTLIAQTLWGTLFCKIFGFSFTTLRLSVLVLSLSGLIFFYLLALRMSRNEKTAFIATVVMAFNPLWFALSYTFMTDIPFLVFLLGSVYFISLYLENHAGRYLFAATLMALIATMIRQLGVWMMIAAILTYLATSRIEEKRILLLIFSAVFVMLVMVVFSVWLEANNILPANFSSLKDLFKDFTFAGFLKNFITRSGILIFYAGLFLLPFVCYVLPSQWEKSKPLIRFIAMVMAVILCLPVYLNMSLFPAGNVINKTGFFPKLLKDTYWGSNWRPVVSDGFIHWLQIAGLLFSFLFMLTLILSIINPGKETTDKTTLIQSGILLAGYAGFLFFGVFFFDRYLLPFIAFLLLFLVSPAIKPMIWNKTLAMIAFALIAWFSFSSTHDNLAFNRARWKGLSSLTKAGISPRNIDGGFEFNGWYETGKRNPVTKYERSWWFVDDDTWIVAQGPVFGYKTIGCYPYFCYFTFRKDTVLILMRAHVVYMDSTVITCDAENLSESGPYFMTPAADVKIGNSETRTNREAHSGNYSIVLDKDHQFGFSMSLKDINPCEKVRVTVWTKNNSNQAGIVVAAPDAEYFYKLSTDQKTGGKDWKLLTLDATFEFDYPFREAGIYVWNYGGESLFFDDLTVIHYRKPSLQ